MTNIDVYASQSDGWHRLRDNYLYGSAPGPKTLPMLGTYSGSNDDTECDTAFGGWPDIATTYYQGNQTINMTGEQTRIDHGTDPLLTITAKSSGYTWTEIGDTSNATTGAWLDQWVSDLNTLQTYAASKGRQVWATIDHEAEVKVNQNLLGFTATDSEYPPVWNRWAAKMIASAPGVKRGYWCGGSDTASINTIGSSLTLSSIQFISMDPYSTTSHSNSETFETTIGNKTNWIQQQSWFPAGTPVGVSEFGIDTSHGDSVCASWLTNIRDHLANLGLIFGVLFDRDSNGNYKIDTGAFPLSVTAFTNSLAEGR